MDNVTDVLHTAIEMERQGHQYYHQAANRIDDPMIRLILDALAKDEAEHLMVISRYYTALEHGKEWPSADNTMHPPKEASARIGEILRETAGTIGPDAGFTTMYDTARDLELKSRDYYQTCADSTVDEAARRFLLFLTALENTHLEMLGMLLNASRSEADK